ncbi:helix-turn-helix domain-containing protein [Levilactobacillus enshiensis]|uniref:helix-turn-helix domain-containing protein n=1 Tax=Levilactobacillus enshiensis TaxID=2590213 RepID=UPI00117B1367|nr:helix-turn-helix transcriptional regulator [Levilactobacillus enshiensis]
MIRSNLAVLLTEKQIKISKMANDTGISRTTLTALSQNTNKMIQMGTINTICTYLESSPSELFEFLPFDFDYYYELGDYDENIWNENHMYTYTSPLYINISENGTRVSTVELNGFIENEGLSDIQTALYGASFHVNGDDNQKIIKPYIDQLSPSFITDVKINIAAYMKQQVKSAVNYNDKNIDIDLDIKISFDTK